MVFVSNADQSLDDESVRAEYPTPEAPRMPSIPAQTAVLLSRLWETEVSGFRIQITGDGHSTDRCIYLCRRAGHDSKGGPRGSGRRTRNAGRPDDHELLLRLHGDRSLELVNERAVWWRERRSGVSAFAYLSSKVLVFGLVCLIFPILAMLGVSIRDKMSDSAAVLHGDLMTYWAPLAATYLCAVASGLSPIRLCRQSEVSVIQPCDLSRGRLQHRASAFCGLCASSCDL